MKVSFCSAKVRPPNTTTTIAVKLAFTSALVFEISQLQSAQNRVVLARTNAIIVRGEHYELVAMRRGGAKICFAASGLYACASFMKFRLYDDVRNRERNSAIAQSRVMTALVQPSSHDRAIDKDSTVMS
jgi:hypothetical protein